MSINYDIDNVFAKVLRGELPSNRLYEDAHVIVIVNINPLTTFHALAIPKGEYKSFTEFSSNASADEKLSFFKAIDQVVKDHHLDDDGYRLVANSGKNARQEVPHFHMHIMGKSLMGEL
jgi:diadenosine tetraphosphate (Ap4A) HIT family hydrolase